LCQRYPIITKWNIRTSITGSRKHHLKVKGQNSMDFPISSWNYLRKRGILFFFADEVGEIDSKNKSNNRRTATSGFFPHKIYGEIYIKLSCNPGITEFTKYPVPKSVNRFHELCLRNLIYRNPLYSLKICGCVELQTVQNLCGITWIDLSKNFLM